MKKTPILSHTIELTIPFYDVDSIGLVWHGNYFRYMENAREALLNSMNYGYRAMIDSGYIWPIVDSHIKYIAPLVFEQQIVINAHLREYENRLKIDYEITDKLTGKKMTKATTTQVAVDNETKAMCFVSPTILLEKLKGYI